MRRSLQVFAFVIVPMFSLWTQGPPVDEKKDEAFKLYTEGNRLFKAGNLKGAIEKYKAAVALAEDFAYYCQLGVTYKEAKQHDNAIAALESSIKLRPNFVGSHNALGGVFLLQGNYDRAIESFKQALKYDPQLKAAKQGISDAYAAKAQQLFGEQRLEQAGAFIDEALQLHADNAKLYLVAARIYNGLERPEKALDAANEALKQRKGKSNGAEYFEIGIAHKKLEEYAKARAAFTEARKDPQYSRNAQRELDGLKGK